MVPTMKTKYRDVVAPELIKSQGYTNKMQVPAVSKIVLNVSVSMAYDRDVLQAVADDLGKITGQKAIIIKAKKSVSNFKLREGTALSAKITLRNDRMYEFMDRLLNVALPRIRDFRGVPSNSFDGRGNYSMGLQEQTVFPEINPDHVKKVHGMDISFVTTAKTDEEARALLRLLGMPFASGKQ
ncbi:MAG: 50S ribosomal protein L5 [Kiritimatiellales bacterium]|nr:50S ribosomal protein L5 [Kiritimatiellales bacterium]